MCALSSKLGLKAAFRGRGRGPWTVQVIFRLDDAGTRLPVGLEEADGEIS